MRIANLLLLICLLSSGIISAQSELLQAVKDENRAAILYQIRLGKQLNDQVKPENYTPLTYAIKKDCSSSFITWLLDQDVDADGLNNGKTPMMYAIKYERNELLPLLLENGALIEKKNSAKETALIYAVKNTKTEAVQFLLDNGANPAQLDYKNKSAISYAKQIGEPEILALLGLEKKYKLGQEGPHVYFNNSDSLIITELKPLKDSIASLEHRVELDSGKTTIKCTTDQGLVSHTFSIHLDINNIPLHVTPDSLPEKVYVFSDINGNFHSLRSFLLNNKLTDINLNWIAGDAHLILLGDVFALGKNVTPTLWLIYELSQKAKAANGDVHLLLGNREIEVLLGNAQNLHLKYRDIEEVTKKAYEDQFSTETILGSWLRNQPMVLKIDSFLFSHAGIHPKLAKDSVSLESINTVLKKTLNNQELNETETELADFILGDEGPSKYKKMAADQMAKKKVADICSFYQVKTIILGQKRVNRSKYLYDKKVLLTNTPKPIDSKSGNPSGVFIKKGHPFILQDKRKVIEI